MNEILGSVRRSVVLRSEVVDKISGLVLPRVVIRWRRGELIGWGAFGHVYMGMNLDSGELLAVKQRYLGTVREEDTLNILLEFVPGGSISSLLGKFGPFPEAVIRMYTKQLLLGLDYLHKNGIMHRDIKGANILVDNKGCIKLADFGASKQVVELANGSGAKSMKGTPYWMAPEVILQTGHSFSADIWSVGCTIIEMATRKPPWSQHYQEVAALFILVPPSLILLFLTSFLLRPRIYC
ncbi:mitogen-activated protein kinase kinase kinase NPK1-like [Bidens hawaiensis]|uniref:mitogen-activated protein kinase kinase kinase NPK1-like n=1 Tax=Bidens hawaiensis TaxID=980011 RepID=UPI00404A9F3D